MMIRSFARTAQALLRPSLVSTSLVVSLAACGAPPPITLDRVPTFHPSLEGWRYVPPTTPPSGGVVPELGTITPFTTSGAFTFEGDVAPGTATLSATVVDVTSEAPPALLGTGSFDVPVDGVAYAGTGEALAASFPDDPGTLLLAAYVVETDAAGVEVGSVVWIVVETADAAAGATVALDGETRVAVFGHGPIDREEPEITAVAVTGTVTFGAVDLSVDGTIEATLAGDFGRVAFEPSERPDPGTEPAPTFATGSYELVLLGPAEAQCEGSLTGREAEVAALSLGLSGGAVEVSGTADALSFSGAAIETSFGAPSVDASWQAEAGAFVAFTEGGAGALGLVEEGRYLLTAGPDAEALLGVVLTDPADPSGAGFCQIGIPATLSAR